MRLRKSIALIPALPLLLGIVACGDDAEATPTPWPTEALTDGGTYRVSYTTDPAPIPLNEPFTLTVTVVGASDDRPISEGITVAADATMPAHGHGMNTSPEVTAQGDGTYTAEGFLFHMEGMWEVVVDITGGEGDEAATFDVECCEE